MRQRLQRFGVLAIIAILLSLPVEASQSGTFNVTLTVSNSAPTISWVSSSLAYTPVENATGIYQFFFNATDGNGASDILDGTAVLKVNLGGQTATSTACTGNSSGNTKAYNCSVPIPYYYVPSAAWAINASVNDSTSTYAENTTQTFTYNTLKAVQLNRASLTFSGGPGQQDVASAENGQAIFNTGNYNFTQLNLTAYSLNSSTFTIGASNFSVNVSNSPIGQALINGTSVNVTGSALNRGNFVNTTLYVYLDVPAGVTAGTYAASNSWIVDAN